MLIDNPYDPRAEIRDILRRLRDLETHASLRNASLSSGQITLLSPGDEPGGAIVAGGVKITADDGGKVGAGGTWIKGDGKLGNDANDLKVTSNAEFAGNVKAAGTFQGAAVEASGTRIDSDGSIKRTGGGSLKVGTNTDFAGNVNVNAAVYADMGVVIPVNGGMNQAGPAIEAAKSAANAAQSTANGAASAASAAQSTANGARSRADAAYSLADGKVSADSPSIQSPTLVGPKVTGITSGSTGGGWAVLLVNTSTGTLRFLPQG